MINLDSFVICLGSSLTAMDAKLSNINGNLQALSSSIKTGIEITNSKVVQLEEHVSELLKEMCMYFTCLCLIQSQEFYYYQY